MDGILIDSEPLWQDAEIEVLARIGVQLTREICKQATGLRTDEAVAYWYRQHPWHGVSQDEIVDEITNAVEKLIKLKGSKMAGVDQAIELCREHGLRLALASSSCVRIINTVLEKLRLTGVFEVLHSGEFEEYGKPHPGIFVTTLNKLELNHTEAFVIEDSFYGILAAKSARMRVVAVPEASVRDEEKYGIADIRLASLEELMESHLRQLNSETNP